LHFHLVQSVVCNLFAAVAAVWAAFVVVDPSVKQNTLNQIKNHSQFKNTNATAEHQTVT
jgi:hypothetical protein